MQDEKILIELARLILPSGFVENFRLTSKSWGARFRLCWIL